MRGQRGIARRARQSLVLTILDVLSTVVAISLTQAHVNHKDGVLLLGTETDEEIVCILKFNPEEK